MLPTPIRRSVAVLFAAVGLCACAHEPIATSGDPIASMEASCMRALLMRGDTWGAQGCMSLADRMRVRRPAAIRSAVSRPGQPMGPITWLTQTPPSGARITVEAAEAGKAIILRISGPIVRGDGRKFATALRRGAAVAPDMVEGAIVLDSPGGSVSEAAIIGRMVRASHLPVAVLPHTQLAGQFSATRVAASSRMARGWRTRLCVGRLSVCGGRCL